MKRTRERKKERERERERERKKKELKHPKLLQFTMVAFNVYRAERISK